ncbi:hypothetical protein V1L54_29285, partial [Streptomyces sp. TRM 70361]|uniref:hypothetical protein n=1 Tax=Streptomyces sp. TRM 70361 TaxID=3116553 RepID=UPI002E7BFEBF
TPGPPRRHAVPPGGRRRTRGNGGAARAQYALANTVDRMHQAHALHAERSDASTEAAAVVRDCEQELARYRNLTDSGAAASETRARRAAPSRERIIEAVDAVRDVAETLRSADERQKNRLYRKLGLRLSYEPGQRRVRVEIAPDPHSLGEWSVSEGGIQPFTNEPWFTGEIDLS